MLLKLWLFGAIAGVYSGREIARRLNWDLRFRHLAGDLRPDFRTVNRFRDRHREDFAALLVETVRIAQGFGLAKLGRLAIDGTKIRANTSRSKAMSHKRMVEAEAELQDEMAQILAQMDELNGAEDDEHGDDDGSGGLPAELQRREARREKIRAARERLEAEKADQLEDRHQKSFADLDANMMKTGEGAMQYCYNAQAAVSEDGIIVATGLSASPSDAPEFIPMVQAAKANTGKRADVVLADAGYRSEENFRRLRQQRQRCVVAMGREGKRTKWPKGRWSQRMHRLMRLPWARELYRHRKTQAERPFAEIKQRMRFRRFSLQGTDKARAEWNLVSAAFNLLTVARAIEA